MASLQYVAPTTVDEACSLLSTYGDDAAILSGGQSLIPELRQGKRPNQVLVDINDIDGTSYIDCSDDQLRVGCLARHSDITASKVVNRTLPILSEVVGTIGDVQVRNRGTFCGGLAHADPAGDPPILALLLNPEIELRSATGTRVVDATSFVTAPHETVLTDDELLTEVRFDILDDNVGVAYEKWTPSEVAWSVATVGAIVKVEDDRIANTRIVTGALGRVPTTWPDVADILRGETPTNDVFVDAALALGEAVDPEDDFEGDPEFKSEMCTTLAMNTFETAVERAK